MHPINRIMQRKKAVKPPLEQSFSTFETLLNYVTCVTCRKGSSCIHDLEITAMLY